MKLFFISFLCIFPLINARSYGGRATDTCIADYLASLGMIDSELGSSDPPSQLCSAIIEVTKAQLLKGVKEEIVNDDNMKLEADCIIETLKKSNFTNYLLITYVYSSDERISAVKKDEMMAHLQKDLTNFTLDSFIHCQSGKKFGEVFDDLFSDSSSDEEELDDAEDYCVRKRIVDSNLINMDQVTIELNPKKIETAKLDCNVLYQKALKDGEDELVKTLLDDDSSEQNDEKKNMKPTEVACLVGVIREDNYIDQMVLFDYIKEMNLDEARKSEMRERFIKIMTKLVKSSSKCFL